MKQFWTKVIISRDECRVRFSVTCLDLEARAMIGIIRLD